MEPITQKIRKTNDCYIFHDTKGDIATLSKYCNMLADKINELNEELQNTKKELKKHTHSTIEKVDFGKPGLL